MPFEQHWNPEQIEEYFLRCTNTPTAAYEHAVPYRRLPISIEFPRNFVEVLKRMHEGSTLDNLERFTYSGVNRDRPAHFINESLLVGTENEIPGDEILEVEKAAEETGNIVTGYWHTHPGAPTPLLSGGDSFALISSSWKENPLHLIGVIADNKVLVALKSREGLDKYPNWLIPDWFTEPWEQRYRVYGRDGRLNQDNVWRMNLGMARWFKFGLYKGEIGSKLSRQLPIRNTSGVS